jgi:hypothetical protein
MADKQTKQELAAGAIVGTMPVVAPVGPRCSRSVRYIGFGVDRKGPLK